MELNSKIGNLVVVLLKIILLLANIYQLLILHYLISHNYKL